MLRKSAAPISAITVIGLIFAGTALSPMAAFAAAENHGPSVVKTNHATQTITVASDVAPASIVRDGFTIILPPPPPPPPPVATARSGTGAAVVSNPTGAQAVAAEMVASRGWGSVEFDCLVSLWKKESGWRVNANNSSSGAYGIPQSLPGSKMASAGSDWETNPATQITWGLGYIQARYDTPCGAWAHSGSVGWY